MFLTVNNFAKQFNQLIKRFHEATFLTLEFITCWEAVVCESRYWGPSVQIRVEATEGPSSDAHRRSRQCRNWMEFLKRGCRRKLKQQHVWGSCVRPSRLFRLRSSGLLAPSLSVSCLYFVSLSRLRCGSPSVSCERAAATVFCHLSCQSSRLHHAWLSVDSCDPLWLSLKDRAMGRSLWWQTSRCEPLDLERRDPDTDWSSHGLRKPEPAEI